MPAMERSRRPAGKAVNKRAACHLLRDPVCNHKRRAWAGTVYARRWPRLEATLLFMIRFEIVATST
jgi:hypothetical protein